MLRTRQWIQSTSVSVGCASLWRRWAVPPILAARCGCQLPSTRQSWCAATTPQHPGQCSLVAAALADDFYIPSHPYPFLPSQAHWLHSGAPLLSRRLGELLSSSLRHHLAAIFSEEEDTTEPDPTLAAIQQRVAEHAAAYGTRSGVEPTRPKQPSMNPDEPAIAFQQLRSPPCLPTL